MRVLQPRNIETVPTASNTPRKAQKKTQQPVGTLLRHELPRSPSFLALRFVTVRCGAGEFFKGVDSCCCFFNEGSKKRPDLPESQTNIDFSSLNASEKIFLDHQQTGLNLQVAFAFVFNSVFVGRGTMLLSTRKMCNSLDFPKVDCQVEAK